MTQSESCMSLRQVNVSALSFGMSLLERAWFWWHLAGVSHWLLGLGAKQSGWWLVCPTKRRKQETLFQAVTGHQTQRSHFFVFFSTSTMQGSFLQARCQEPIMTTDWGVPLIIALLLLGLIYAFLYLPAITQRALLEQALNNQSANVDFLPKEDWEEVCFHLSTMYSYANNLNLKARDHCRQPFQVFKFFCFMHKTKTPRIAPEMVNHILPQLVEEEGGGLWSSEISRHIGQPCVSSPTRGRGISHTEVIIAAYRVSQKESLWY